MHDLLQTRESTGHGDSAASKWKNIQLENVQLCHYSEGTDDSKRKTVNTALRNLPRL